MEGELGRQAGTLPALCMGPGTFIEGHYAGDCYPEKMQVQLLAHKSELLVSRGWPSTWSSEKQQDL